MAKTETPAALPTIERVSIAALPDATKSVTPATIALGTSFIEAMTDGEAASEATIHTTRPDAVKRIAIIKRAIAAVDKALTITSRVYAVDGGFRTAVYPKPAETSDTPDGSGE